MEQTNAGDPEGAHRNFAAALQIALRISDGSTRALTLVELVENQAAARAFANAFDTSARIEDPDLRARSYLEVGQAQARAGLAEDARRSLREAVKAAEAIQDGDDYAMPYRLESITRAQAEARLFSDAQDTASRIESVKFKAQALRHISASQAKAGLWDKARETVGRIEVPGVLAFAFLDISREKAAVGLMEDARRLLSQARDIVDATVYAGETEKTGQVLASISGEQLANGFIDEASVTAGNIEEPFTKARAMLDVARAQAATGRTDDARRSFASAAQAAERIDSPSTRLWVVNNIGRAESETGLVTEAHRTFAMAAKIAETIEVEAHRAGEPEDLKGIFERAGCMVLFNSEPGIKIAKAKAEAGFLEAALQMARGGDYACRRASVLMSIAGGLTKGIEK